MTMTQTMPKKGSLVVGGLIAGRPWALEKMIEGLQNQEAPDWDIKYFFVIDKHAEKIACDFTASTIPLHPIVKLEIIGLEPAPTTNIRPGYSLERLAALRNIWITKAFETYPWVNGAVIIDSDIELEPEGIQQLASHLLYPERPRLVAAPLRNSTAPNVFNFLWKYQNGYSRKTPEGIDFTKLFPVDLTGACLLIPEQFKHIRWKGDDFKRIGEDNGLADYCSEHGIKFRVDPNIITHHWMKENQPPLSHYPGDIQNALRPQR